jgi:acyl-CoA thioesterase FadM
VSWLETYRGTVHRWEVDPVDHFTVAYYFERLEESTVTMLRALGLDDALPAVRECRVRYIRELRVGDILHIRSGVLSAGERGLVLGHEVVDSANDTVCTTVEMRVDAVLDAAGRERARALAAVWSTMPEPSRPDAGGAPADDAGFVDASLDTVKPWEVGRQGHADWPAHIHRFTAANGHVIAAFGMTPAYMREQRRGFSTFEFKLRFEGTVGLGRQVRVRSGLLHVGTSSMRILHRMVDTATGKLVATLEQSGVHLDLVARRPAPLPDDLRERARALVVAR